MDSERIYSEPSFLGGLPMILITAAYTASRPGELLDAGRKRKKKMPEQKKEGYEPWDGCGR